MRPIFYLKHHVGNLRDDRVFVTWRRPEHVFRKFDGVGMSVNVLMMLRQMRCRSIVILFEKRNGEVKKFLASTDLFLEKGHVWPDGLDYQRILSFSDMTQKKIGDFVEEV